MRVVTAVVVALVAGAAHARLGAEAPDGGGGSGADGAQGGAQGSPTPSGSGQVPAAQDPYAHERSHPEGAHVGPHYVEFVAAKTAPSDENPVDGYRPSYVRSGYFREVRSARAPGPGHPLSAQSSRTSAFAASRAREDAAGGA